MSECPNCRKLEEKIREYEEWKKQYDKWRMKWQFRRGLLVGLCFFLLLINLLQLILH